jgi:hypothetical protein
VLPALPGLAVMALSAFGAIRRAVDALVLASPFTMMLLVLL